MREVVVNGRFLARRITGVERYGREILAIIGGKCRVEETRGQGVRGHAWEQFFLPSRLNRNSVLWSPANTGPLAIRNQALTIHDLSALEHPEYFTASFSTWYRLAMPLLARMVQVIFAPSHYIQRKVIQRFSVKNVIVTPNGVNTTFFSPDATQRLQDLPERYILFVGSLQLRKNIDVLLRAWKEMRHEYPELWLVIGGDRGRVFKTSKNSASEKVKYLGYVDEHDLPGLYAHAKLFVLPSLDEGFGLPALEAMACGTPVIVSDAGALPEVVGNAARVFKSSDACSLYKQMRECMENERLSSALISSGFERIKHFRWEFSAELVWKALNEI